MLKNVISYSNPADFTYNASDIEIAGNEAKLAVKVWPGAASEVAYWNFSIDSSLVSKRGGQTISLPDYNIANPNVGEVINDWLELKGDTFSYGSLLGVPKIDNGSNPTVSCKIKVNFATISSQKNIITLTNSGNSASIRFYFSNQGGGVTRIYGELKNNPGTIVFSSIIGTRTFAVDDVIEIGFSRESGSGNYYFTLDGVKSATVGATVLFDDINLDLGGPYSNRTNFSYSDLQLWNGLDRIDLEIPGGGQRAPQSTYNTNDPVLEVNAKVTATELIDLSDDTFGENPPNTEINYIVEVNGVDKYFDGLNWVNSDLSYAQSNTPVEITANLGTLDLIGGTLIGLKVLFHSMDGENTPVVAETSLCYTNTYTSGSVAVCNVKGTILDASGFPVAGAKIKIDSSDHFNTESAITKEAFVYSDTSGNFSLPAVETATTGTTANITVEYRQNGRLIRYVNANKTIPNQSEAFLSNLV